MLLQGCQLCEVWRYHLVAYVIAYFRSFGTGILRCWLFSEIICEKWAISLVATGAGFVWMEHWAFGRVGIQNSPILWSLQRSGPSNVLACWHNWAASGSPRSVVKFLLPHFVQHCLLPLVASVDKSSSLACYVGNPWAFIRIFWCLYFNVIALLCLFDDCRCRTSTEKKLGQQEAWWLLRRPQITVRFPKD